MTLLVGSVISHKSLTFHTRPLRLLLSGMFARFLPMHWSFFPYFGLYSRALAEPLAMLDADFASDVVDSDQSDVFDTPVNTKKRQDDYNSAMYVIASTLCWQTKDLFLPAVHKLKRPWPTLSLCPREKERRKCGFLGSLLLPTFLLSSIQTHAGLRRYR